MKFLQNIFSGRGSTAPQAPIPPRPADWKLTPEDLMREMQEGKRKSVGNPEIIWAREYQKSLIPSDMRYPEKGDVYECSEDHAITYMTAWSAPFTGDGETILRAGDRIHIHTAPDDPEPIGVYALPLNYQSMEKRIVPDKERTNPNYVGFYFYIDTISLNRNFTLIQSGSSLNEQAE